MTVGKYDDLPTWEELRELTSWVHNGCPPVPGRITQVEPARAFRSLLKLLNGLPHHLPHYAYGTDEWRAELARLRQEAQDQEDAIGDGKEATP